MTKNKTGKLTKKDISRCLFPAYKESLRLENKLHPITLNLNDIKNNVQKK